MRHIAFAFFTGCIALAPVAFAQQPSESPATASSAGTSSAPATNENGPPPTAPQTAPPPEPPVLPRDNVRPRSFGVFVNPTNLLFGIVNVEFDYSPLRFLALAGQLTYLGRDSTTAVGGGVAAQFFMTGDRSFEGLYFRLAGDLLHVSTDVGFGSASALGYVAGGTLGYQWAWDIGIALRVGAGAQYINMSVDARSSSGQVAKAGFEGILPSIDLALGFVF